MLPPYFAARFGTQRGRESTIADVATTKLLEKDKIIVCELVLESGERAGVLRLTGGQHYSTGVCRDGREPKGHVARPTR